MKKVKFFLSVMFLLVALTNVQANDVDHLLLTNGTVVSGEIVKFGTNSFKIMTSEGSIRIKNYDVSLVAIGKDLTSGEKMRLGILDGKRYAKNKVGNIAVGFFFGLIGSAIVYLSSDQMPGYEAMNGPNKAIVDDANYLAGFEKGARKKSGGNALIGTAASVLLLIGLTVSA